MIVDLVLNDLKAYVNNAVMECSIAVNDGRIFKIGSRARMPKADAKIALRGLLVLPGLIDVHVHLRDEGEAHKEDFYSGTAAAATGGITTVLDMPNNKPVTMSVEALRNRMNAAKKRVLVNVGFYSEFPKELEEIRKVIGEGAAAFKLFMDKQVGGLNVSDNEALVKAFKAVSSSVPIAIHAEDKGALEEAKSKAGRGLNGVKAFLKAHPEEAEVKAIKRLLAAVKLTGANVHVCHLSTEQGLKAVIEGKESGLSVTCEVTPHHLLLSASDLIKIGTLALTEPPVRSKRHVKALWAGVKSGWIDVVASDHAPHTLEEKEADVIWDVKAGIPGLETALPLLLTEVNRGRLTISDVVKLMAEGPAKTFRLSDRGSLKEGKRADLTVVDMKAKGRIDASSFRSKAKYSPFDGWKFVGKPVKTFVNGRLVMEDGEIVSEAGSGQIIKGCRA